MGSSRYGKSYRGLMTLGMLLVGTIGSLGVSELVEAQVLSGQTAGDSFGWSVAYAGDVNNDGLADLLVGIPDRDQAGQDAGEVHLYLGQDGMFPSTPDLVIPGQASGDEFGYAVSTVGDINKDGYDDFLVGAPGRSTTGLDAGRVYLFLGGSPPNGTADMTWDGNIPQGRFGASVAGGFDFNRDERSDFAVGAPMHNGAGLRVGQVRIFLGSATGLATETYVLDGDLPNWGLGQSLDPGGDLNGDSFDDLVAGAPQSFDLNSGRVVVWFGQSSSLVDPSRLVFSGEVSGDQFGFDVSGAGDVNGDGTDDLLVGAPRQALDNGAVYLFHGGTSMNTGFDWKATGGAAGDLLGGAVDGGFDISGDTKPDIVAGAPGTNSTAAGAGRVLIYYGKASPNVDPDSTLDPSAPVSSFEAGDAFGFSVQYLGSLDGHNAAELAAGAPSGNAANGGEAGYINLVTHPPEMTPVRLLAFTAVRLGSGVELQWDLAETAELAGLRLETGEKGSTRPLHQGWLLPGLRRFVDPGAGAPEGFYRLIGLDRVGAVSVLGETRVSIGGTVLALRVLNQNPFRDQLRLQLSSAGGPVRVSVWDIQGRQIRSLLERDLPAGTRSLVWDGRNDQGLRVSPGLYIVLARAGGSESSLKVIRLP